MVDWKIAAQEDAETWNTFIGALSRQGITEETTPLVISDGPKGLPTALERPLPCGPHQRCLFHTIKHIAHH